MVFLPAVLLGLVQGLTEFLPVSSSGHLVLAHELFGYVSSNDLAFDAILHLATAFAVVVYFWQDIWTLIQTVIRKLDRVPVDEKNMNMVLALLAGTVPAVILGLLLESYMETIFRNPLLVAGVLVAGSLLFALAEWVYMNRERDSRVSLMKGLKIGLFQSLALVPGMSRSGASIAGGMMLGLSRVEAARFSFLLAVPIMLGAGSKKVLELMSSPTSVEWGAVVAGAATAFIVGLLAVHFMLSFVRNHTLWPFIWYRILLALTVIFIVTVGS